MLNYSWRKYEKSYLLEILVLDKSLKGRVQLMFTIQSIYWTLCVLACSICHIKIIGYLIWKTYLVGMLNSYWGKLSYNMQVTSCLCYMLFPCAASPQLEPPLIDFTYTRRYSLLCLPSSSSCRRLWPLAKFFLLPFREKDNSYFGIFNYKNQNKLF